MFISDHLDRSLVNSRPFAWDLPKATPKVRCHLGNRCGGTLVVRRLRSRGQRISAGGGVANRYPNPYARTRVDTQILCILPACRQFISSEAPVTCRMSDLSDPYSRMGRLRTILAFASILVPRSESCHMSILDAGRRTKL